MTRRLGLAMVGVVAVLLLSATPASAHPLGNFTVNHYHGLRIEQSGVTDHAVVDLAEIPTAQAESQVDADGDGRATEAERAAHADQRCRTLRDELELTLDGEPLTVEVAAAEFSYRPGEAGLPVSRLTCDLRADADMASARTLVLEDGFEDNRVGWREITVISGEGVHFEESSVPATSVTDALETYPDDLLASPLDVRTATITVGPGSGTSSVADVFVAGPDAGPISRALASVNRTFTDLVGRDQVTVSVGLLAIGLALLLGASHALLPGHGKTVMAAYIAGRQGSMRDALVVGATVTVTHTAGVIGLGLALTISSSLAGESVLRWLGLGSGLLVASLGVGLAVSAARGRRTSHHRGFGGHHHHHDHDHHEDHVHLHAHDHVHGTRSPVGRRGLVAMGIAGGLVPSPSALVVLLATIALGRTVFGLLLVICYGLGMAATLTATGLALVRLRDRFGSTVAERWTRRVSMRWTRLMPFATASIVIVVGLLLASRSFTGAV